MFRPITIDGHEFSEQETFYLIGLVNHYAKIGTHPDDVELHLKDYKVEKVAMPNWEEYLIKHPDSSRRHYVIRADE